MITNCKNCGAPLKGSRCSYCGTSIYETEENLGIQFHSRVPGEVEVRFTTSVPEEIFYRMGKEKALEQIKISMIESMAKDLARFVYTKECFDPVDLKTRVCGVLHVVDKDSLR